MAYDYWGVAYLFSSDATCTLSILDVGPTTAPPVGPTNGPCVARVATGEHLSSHNAMLPSRDPVAKQ